MARVLRVYEHPIATSAGRNVKTHDEGFSVYSFVKKIPRNVSPISHVIVPQTVGLNPNARISPLCGYYIRYKGKFQENSIRRGKLHFMTGTIKRIDNSTGNDWDPINHVFRETYAVYGPFGMIGIKAMYAYDLTDYFTSKESYSLKNDENIQKQTQIQDEASKIQYKTDKIYGQQSNQSRKSQKDSVRQTREYEYKIDDMDMDDDMSGYEPTYEDDQETSMILDDEDSFEDWWNTT